MLDWSKISSILNITRFFQVGIEELYKIIWKWIRWIIVMWVILLLSLTWAFLAGWRNPWLYFALGCAIAFLVTLTAGVLIIALIGYLKIRREQALEGQTQEAIETESAGAIALANERIKELEAESAKAAKEAERFERETIRHKEWEQSHTILAVQNQALLEKYAWLHQRADSQQEDITAFVRLTNCCIQIGESDTDGELPFIVFGLCITNSSVFGVTAKINREGSVIFQGRSCDSSIKPRFEDTVEILSGNNTWIFIEQRLSRDERDYMRSARGKRDPVFYFHELQITVQGTRHFPQVKPLPLRIGRDVFADGAALLLGSKPKLIFEIHEQGTHVSIEGDTQARRVAAVVNMRFINSDTLPIPILEFFATLLKHGSPDTQEATTEPIVILRDPATKRVISSDQTLKIEPSDITEYAPNVFYLVISPEMEERLSRDHFIRITMRALGQSDYWQDFYVVDWRVTRVKSSLVTLKRD